MYRGMTVRSVVVIIGLLVVLALIYSFIIGARRAYVIVSPGGDLTPYQPSPLVSDEQNALLAWMDRLLRRRDAWSVEDANRLSPVLYPRYSEEYYDDTMKPGVTPSDAMFYIAESQAIDTVAYRLRHNDPIEPDARNLLVGTLLERLEDPYWRIRHDTLHPFTHSRLPLDPLMRERVEAMFDDPDPRVADAARAALDAFDREERLRAEGKLQERGIDYAVRKR